MRRFSVKMGDEGQSIASKLCYIINRVSNLPLPRRVDFPAGKPIHARIYVGNNRAGVGLGVIPLKLPVLVAQMFHSVQAWRSVPLAPPPSALPRTSWWRFPSLTPRTVEVAASFWDTRSKRNYDEEKCDLCNGRGFHDFSEKLSPDSVMPLARKWDYSNRNRLPAAAIPQRRGRAEAGGSHDFLIALMVNDYLPTATWDTLRL
nr:hypothetical protein Iba_chr02bCG25390 [Ipomoea batatas]